MSALRVALFIALVVTLACTSQAGALEDAKHVLASQSFKDLPCAGSAATCARLDGYQSLAEVAGNTGKTTIRDSSITEAGKRTYSPHAKVSSKLESETEVLGRSEYKIAKDVVSSAISPPPPTSSSLSSSSSSHASSLAIHRKSDAETAAGALYYHAPVDATNVTFANNLCASLSSSHLTLFLYTAPEFPDWTPLLLPDCLNDYAVDIQSLSLTGAFLINDWAIVPYGLKLFSMTQGQLGPAAMGSAIGFNGFEIDWDGVFTHMPNLVSFSISSAMLIGTLPTKLPAQLSLFSLVNLPGLSGSIPPGLLSSWNSLSSSPNNYLLSIYNTSISGPLPEALFASIPTNFSTLQQSVSFAAQLFDNQLIGSIPALWLDTFENANFSSFTLDLSGNALSGTIPSSFFPPGLVDTTSPMVNMLITHFHFGISNNRIEGTLPPLLFAHMNTHTFTFRAAHNLLIGLLPSTLFPTPYTLDFISEINVDLSNNGFSGEIPENLVKSGFPQNTSMAVLIVNLSNNMLAGTIPEHLFYTYDFGSPYPTTLKGMGDFIFKVRSNKLTGTLPASLAIFPTRLSNAILDAGDNLFSGPLPASYATNTWANILIDQNPTFNGTIPAEFSHPFALALNASGTAIAGDLPAPRVYFAKIDLSHTLVNFCSAPSNTSLKDVGPDRCFISYTEACECPQAFSNCQLLCNSLPSSALPSSPISSPPSSNCTLPAPSPQFICDNGRWVITTTTTTTITIPADLGTVIIKGNITSSTIIIGGTGSTVVLEGCAGNLTGIVVELTKQDLEKLDPKTIYPLLTLGNGSSRCNDLSSVVVSTRVKDGGCRKVKSVTPSTWTSNSLGALFVVDSSGCNRWWIILVSVIAVVVLIGVAAGVVGIVLWNRNKLLKADTLVDDLAKKH